MRNNNVCVCVFNKKTKHTSCWLVIRQAHEWIAGPGLTVGETGCWDVLDHLVGLRRLHLHQDLKGIDSVFKSERMNPGIMWEAPINPPAAGAGRSACLCSQTGTPCVWRRCAWCSAPHTLSRPPSAALARRTWIEGRDPGILGWLLVVLLRRRKDRSVWKGLDLWPGDRPPTYLGRCPVVTEPTFLAACWWQRERVLGKKTKIY